ncbi:MAG: ROK family protein [Candidatus Thermoplasmatota archaeon]
MAAAQSGSSRTGRPLAIGIDVGATKLLVAAVDAKGKALRIVQAATPAADGPDAVVRAMLDAVTACQGGPDGTLASVGIGFAGQVSGGVVRSSPNLAGWHDVPLATRLRRRLEVPVALTNDARAAAWAESRYGQARGLRDVVFLALGTGIGAGILSGGVLLEGAAGSAGELGHVPVVAGGRVCNCGGRGCLEAYAGGWALAQEARRAARAHPRAGRALLALAGSPARIDARVLARSCAAGDLLSQGIVAEAGRMLGVACVGIVNAFNPEALILGGGLAQGFPQLVADVRRSVRAASLAPARRVRVLRTRLGPGAVAIGAADLGRRKADLPA